MNRPRNKRIGRNDPCHCGSGKKFKHCHGEPPPVPIDRSPLPAEMQRVIAEHHASELRRESQHGRGKPVVSAQFKGYRFLRVGGKLRYGKWRTFEDFLLNDIKSVLGLEWGSAEERQPLEERHPILQWAEAVGRLHRDTTRAEPGRIVSAPMTGATAAYLGLAYNLFLLEDNAEVRNDLVNKLKSREHFPGALHETFVAACFIRAGFTLALEDERDSSRDHGEFIATHKDSGQAYWVEAKSRQPNKGEPKIATRLRKALSKRTDLPRVVMIDANRDDIDAETPEVWMKAAQAEVRDSESTLVVNGKPAPPAYVIVTNRPYHYDLEGTRFSRATFAEGFKIPDFGASATFDSLIEAHKAMQKHAAVFAVVDAIRRYQIPSTFDGEIPEFAFGDAERKWKIGEQYDLSEYEQGAMGVLTAGAVMETDKSVHLAFQLRDGRTLTMDAVLSDKEVAAYQRHPETFFGVHRNVTKQFEDPLSLFEFFHDSYKKTPRARLLESMKTAPDFERLSRLPDDELLLEYCDRCVAGALAIPAARKAGPPTG